MRRKTAEELFILPSLVPGALPTYPRHRWVGGERTCDWIGLLEAHHSLFSRAMRRMLADDTPTPRLAVVPAPAVNAESGWAAAAEELLSGAGDVASVVPNLDEEGGDVDPGPDAAVPAQGFDWAEFNRSMRRKVLSWVEEDVSNICIMRWLMNYSTRLLARMFKLSGAEWERDQATQADDRSYRIVEAMMKRDLDPTFEEMEQAFCHVPPALPQKRWTRSTRSLTFRMLSRLSVSLDFHCASLREACPFVIAGLLLGDEVAEGVAEEIFSMPRCVCDALTLKLRGMFPTPAALASSRAVAIVRGLAQLARVDVSNIECGHASVRHIVEGKSNQTWDVVLPLLSAEPLRHRLGFLLLPCPE